MISHLFLECCELLVVSSGTLTFFISTQRSSMTSIMRAGINVNYTTTLDRRDYACRHYFDTFPRLSRGMQDETTTGATIRDFIFYRRDQTRFYESLVLLVSWSTLTVINILFLWVSGFSLQQNSKRIIAPNQY